MTLTQLSYVVAVAQHRNFGLAAEACYVTQPTLSMQIQKLEEELGVLIFDRSQQPIRSTMIGDKIIQQARIALAEAAKIPEMTAEQTNEVKGPITIGVIPTLSPYVLPLFIQNFVSKYPEAVVTVEELQTHEMISRLKSDQLDVGLLVTPLHSANIVEHPLFYEPFLLYVSPSHPLYQAKRVRENELSFKDVWLLTEGHCFRDQVINLCVDRRRATENKNNLRFESGSLETLKKMVDQSQGYTLLPLLAAEDVHDPIKKKQIKEFHPPVPTREVSLVHSRLYKKRATVDALVAEIRSSLPQKLLKLKEGRFHRVDMPPIED
jgi:LysR family transcriptional regulator, hydrogen peroxide-inducible genes activator